MDDKNVIILKLVKSHGLSDWDTCDCSIKHNHGSFNSFLPGNL